MANIRFADVVEYFRTVATELKVIGHSETETHFCRINMDEVFGGLKTKMKFPALIMEAPDFFIYDEHSDNELKGLNIGFMVVQKVQPGNFEKEEQALDLMEEAVTDIVSRMRKEHREYSTAGIISKSFQENTVRWSKVGPLWENCFGWRVTLQVMNAQDFSYDETKWNS